MIKLKYHRGRRILPKKTELPLLLALQPSRRLKLLLVVMHMLALASSFANALPVAVKLALMVGLCLHFWLVIRRLKDKPYIIRQSDALGWEVSCGNGFESIQILNSTVITVFALFLHFKNSAGKQSLLIVNDALTEDDYRRLIVRLKTA